VEMDVGADHLEDGGRVATGTLFSLADCAMSLISNAETTALAVATHLTRSGDAGAASVLRADIRPALPGGDRETTWRATLTADGVEVASFTGTTLRVGKG
jgi:acyl-coenzyme A thioesterase PaaI-like protein